MTRDAATETGHAPAPTGMTPSASGRPRRARAVLPVLPPFPQAARAAVGDAQLRRNLGRATTTIRAKRAAVVAELPDWEALRAAGAAAKDEALAHLDGYLLQLEERVTAAGGHVHWARDAAEANALVAGLVRATGARSVVKVKSLATDEIGLNAALAAEGIAAIETDLAELIVQLAGETPSHILVPAIHKNRAEIRALFLRTLAPALGLGPADLPDEPAALAAAARAHLRRAFLAAEVAVSGANFAIAETGAVGVVESEGNGRMCVTLPRVLITVMGIEKVLPRWDDLGAFLQLLPRSSTGERMNPYTSLWTGVRPAATGDGPRAFHLVLLDNGRTAALADGTGRQALRCIRCSACLNVCPVYARAGGHAYGATYPGPIGAILTPQLLGVANAATLPYASTLCGACADVCPVNIDIPALLLHLRGRVVAEQAAHASPVGTALALARGDATAQEAAGMALLAATFADRRRYERAQRLARLGQRPFVRGVGRRDRRGMDGKTGSRATEADSATITALPGLLAGWTSVRDLRPVPPQPFRDWWRERADDATKRSGA